MKRVLVIADDLTGAAEIAGIARRFGFDTQILRDDVSSSPRVRDGLTVIDTDSRLLAPDDAARRVADLVAPLDPSSFDLVYKKTDSALRGPIAGELEALRPWSGRTAAILVAQNPSRGRVIDDAGIYRIDGTPLHHTSFANDPDHPAHSSNAATVVGGGARCATIDEPLATLTIGAATTSDEIRSWTKRVDATVLPAGGADFFTTLLESRGARASERFVERLDPGPTLFVCGSASAYSVELAERARREDVPVIPMPASVDEWIDQVLDVVLSSDRVLVTIGRAIDRTPGVSQKYQSAIAELVHEVLSPKVIVNLLVDGGATASSVCRRMEWRELEVTGELAPGVVRMLTADAQTIIIKPGSYAWPELVWNVTLC